MVEIINDMSAVKLIGHNLLLKALSAKIRREDRRFIRIAVKGDSNNEILLAAPSVGDAEGGQLG